MGLTRNTLLQRPECSREKVWNRVKISATFTVGGSLYPELGEGGNSPLRILRGAG